MKDFLKHNWLFLVLYTIALTVSAYFLLHIDKVQIHVAINSLTGNSFVDVFFKYFTHLGDGITAGIISAIVLLLNAKKGLYLSLTWAISGLVTWLLKTYYFVSFRPHFVFGYFVEHIKLKYIEGVEMLSQNSFPSGHATTSFAIFASLIFVTDNKFLKVFFISCAFLSAFSRTYLSQHWLVDITIGSLIGTISAIVFYFIIIAPNRLQKLDKPILKIFNP